LRRSLIPSLLEARRINESLANETIELFEAAKVYLPSTKGLPAEPWMVALSSGRDFRAVKGTVQTMLEGLHIAGSLETAPLTTDWLDPRECCLLRVGDQVVGLLGRVGPEALKQLGLRNSTVVAELKLDELTRLARLTPQFRPLSPYPAIDYDFNFIVNEAVRWADLDATVRQAAGPVLETIEYQETYRDPQRDGAGRKRLLLSVRLRSAEQTLTGQQADAVRQAIIDACQQQHGASLV
jgi:phenylalanyl-tRNA synthetase beta chain